MPVTDLDEDVGLDGLTVVVKVQVSVGGEERDPKRAQHRHDDDRQGAERAGHDLEKAIFYSTFPELRERLKGSPRG